MRLTLRDVQRFFVAKNISGACPCCQSMESYIVGFNANDSIPGFLYGTHPEGPYDYSYGLASAVLKPVVSVECANCGYIRAFNYHLVFNWVVQNPELPPAPPLNFNSGEDA